MESKKEKTKWVSVGIGGWIDVEVPVDMNDDDIMNFAFSEVYERPMDFKIQETEIIMDY